MSKIANWKENGIRGVWFTSALFASLAVIFILGYLLITALPAFLEVGIFDFLFGTEWNPTGSTPSYGIGALIVGTLLVTAGAMLIAVPLGLLTAVFLAYAAPKKLRDAVKPAVELLAGIPSVVYGFFGMLVLCSFLQKTLDIPSGFSWAAASVILGIMALPTIVSVSEDALSAVPKDFREASLGLGATRTQTIFCVLLPAAASGISAAVVLGMGRAIGETMAVMMVAGNSAIIPSPLWDVLSPIRTLTATLGIELAEVSAGSMHYHALFGIAVILLVITLLVNLASRFVTKRIEQGKPLFILPSLPSLPIRISPRITEKAAFAGIYLGTFAVLAVLAVILGNIFINGIPAVTWEFLTESPKDLGRAGGIFPAIIGTLELVFGAILIALPIGIGAAVYLNEYAGSSRITSLLRTGIDLLSGTPSIVFGVFGFAFLVLFLGWGISLLAGMICLALMILPTIIKTTEEALKAVPQSLREASFGLGAARSQTILRVVLPAAASGIITGAVLSLGRAAGETAPIMFTAVVFSKRFITPDLFEPVMALPFHLYVLTTSVPNTEPQQYATAVVLICLVAVFYIAAAVLRKKLQKNLS